MQKASLEIMQVFFLVLGGGFLFWVWIKIRELAGFKARERFNRVEEDIAKSTIANNNTDLEDLIDRENRRATNTKH